MVVAVKAPRGDPSGELLSFGHVLGFWTLSRLAYSAMFSESKGGCCFSFSSTLGSMN